MHANHFREIFLLSKLRYFVDNNNSRKLFFNVNTMPYIDCASKRAVKIIFPTTTLTTDKYFCLKMKIMSLHKRLEYNKGVPHTVYLKNEAPEFIFLTSITLFLLQELSLLICLGQGYTFSKQV